MTRRPNSTKSTATSGVEAVKGSPGKLKALSERQITLARALVSASSILTLSTDAGKTADLAVSPPSAPVVLPEVPVHWFVRIGLLGAVEQSSSKLYAQTTVAGFGVGPQLLLEGRDESFSNLLTIGVQGGYFVTPNWSVEIAGGFPVWQTAKITGYSPAGPAAGTVLSKSLPASLPITVAYHFTQFGALQPYLGGGVAPVFVLGQRDAYAVGATTEPSVALVLQGGFDYMFNQNWGAYFDAKKYFDRSIGKATSLNVGPPVGVIDVAASSVTNSQPWVLSTGVTYRF